MSDSEEESGSVGRQKSIFSGMGRWARPKSPPSSPWNRRSSPDKYPPGPYGDSGCRVAQRTPSVNGSPRRQPVVTVVDMERYLAINTWLERNGINAAQSNTLGPDKCGNSKEYGLFDDMYSSLDALENSLMSELSHLGYSNVASAIVKEVQAQILIQVLDFWCMTELTCTIYILWQNPGEPRSSPALLDYLVVIAPDMVDVAIRNFWNLRENVFEATVAFAHPAESQFIAESLEHFCFPTGIKATTTGASTSVSIDKGGDHLSDKISVSSREGDFFVLMISGGGAQGQSVQYAMCMKGMVQIRDSGDAGNFLILPICYCVVARIPLIPFFRTLLQGLLGKKVDVLSVDVFPSPNSALVLTRPHKENDLDEKVVLLLQWALPSLLSRLSIDRLLQILSLLLVEMKLIVVSDEIPLLSAATLGLASLLHPLGWSGPLISVLPPSMHEYMEVRLQTVATEIG
ncbi:unnamed protein product [Phytophthora fragariaefolia]|uniref:Unnamed protein product n=1 Tax=Phytophthora fragariaefolia TaxID=1490495 RepID=A0A9W6TU81_9STRA|nr:unnamed protein product [Phytophthora fragariaefolia]